MEGWVRKVAITIGIVVGLLVLLVGLGVVFFRSENNKMTAIETQEIVEGVYAVKDITGLGTPVSLYLIKSENRYVAIDAGNDAEHVRQELDKLNIDPQEVVAVLLTHTDIDHIAALSLFNNAVFYIAEAEEQMIDGRTARAPFSHNTLDYEYELIEDGQIINVLGFKVQGILTPGHTLGSMSFLIDDKYLFAGDAVALVDGKAYLSNGFFYMDSKAQRATTEKIAKLTGVEYVFTGHHGFTDDHSKAFADWIE